MVQTQNTLGIPVMNDIITISSVRYRRDSARRRPLVTPFKVIQGHQFWYQSKARMPLTISE